MNIIKSDDNEVTRGGMSLWRLAIIVLFCITIASSCISLNFMAKFASHSDSAGNALVAGYNVTAEIIGNTSATVNEAQGASLNGSDFDNMTIRVTNNGEVKIKVDIFLEPNPLLPLEAFRSGDFKITLKDIESFKDSKDKYPDVNNWLQFAHELWVIESGKSMDFPLKIYINDNNLAYSAEDYTFRFRMYINQVD